MAASTGRSRVPSVESVGPGRGVAALETVGEERRFDRDRHGAETGVPEAVVHPVRERVDTPGGRLVGERPVAAEASVEGPQRGRVDEDRREGIVLLVRVGTGPVVRQDVPVDGALVRWVTRSESGTAVPLAAARSADSHQVIGAPSASCTFGSASTSVSVSTPADRVNGGPSPKKNVSSVSGSNDPSSSSRYRRRVSTRASSSPPESGFAGASSKSSSKLATSASASPVRPRWAPSIRSRRTSAVPSVGVGETTASVVGRANRPPPFSHQTKSSASAAADDVEISVAVDVRRGHRLGAREGRIDRVLGRGGAVAGRVLEPAERVPDARGTEDVGVPVAVQVARRDGEGAVGGGRDRVLGGVGDLGRARRGSESAGGQEQYGTGEWAAYGSHDSLLGHGIARFPTLAVSVAEESRWCTERFQYLPSASSEVVSRGPEVRTTLPPLPGDGPRGVDASQGLRSAPLVTARNEAREGAPQEDPQWSPHGRRTAGAATSADEPCVATALD